MGRFETGGGPPPLPWDVPESVGNAPASGRFKNAIGVMRAGAERHADRLTDPLFQEQVLKLGAEIVDTSVGVLEVATTDKRLRFRAARGLARVVLPGVAKKGIDAGKQVVDAHQKYAGGSLVDRTAGIANRLGQRGQAPDLSSISSWDQEPPHPFGDAPSLPGQSGPTSYEQHPFQADAFIPDSGQPPLPLANGPASRPGSDVPPPLPF